jgi:hypothetical protein
MLHMGKEEFRRYAGKLTAQKYEALVWTRQNAPPPPKDAEALLKVESRYSLEAAMNVAGAEYFWRCVRYIRQPGRALNDLRDYWQMAGALDMDLDDQQVRWPKDLRRAHDAAAERLDEIKEAELNESFVKRLQQLSAYAWSADGILIRPCATQAELKREGKDLHHCVATYAKGHATGQTAIFFVRREEEPDEPWYTLELDEQTLTVRQNRGLRNCDKTPEVQAFEDAWIEHLKEQRKQEKKAKKAKKKGAKVA